MDNLEKSFQIPQKHCPMVFRRYYSAVYWHNQKNNPNFKMKEFDQSFCDFLDNYWIKYHNDSEINLRLMLSQLANCSMDDLPSELLYYSSTAKKSLFHHYVSEEPQFQYYYSVIFDPYFQNIKLVLINYDALFGALSDKFLKNMIVNHLNDYQNDYLILNQKYKEGLPCFYERVIYYGFNVLDKNYNEDYKVILSQIYMNYKNKAA